MSQERCDTSKVREEKAKIVDENWKVHRICFPCSKLWVEIKKLWVIFTSVWPLSQRRPCCEIHWKLIYKTKKIVESKLTVQEYAWWRGTRKVITGETVLLCRYGHQKYKLSWCTGYFSQTGTDIYPQLFGFYHFISTRWHGQYSKLLIADSYHKSRE
jgi:hypothetical protein